MKKSIFLLLITVFVFTGCNVNNDKGSIPITLPDPGSLSEAVRAEGDYEWARLYLATDNGFYNIDESTEEKYYDISAELGSYTINDLDPGKLYSIYIMFGSKTGNVFHSVIAYGFTEGEQITSGINNEIVISIEESAVTWDANFAGVSVQQMLNVGEVDHYLTSDGTIYKEDYVDENKLDIEFNDISSMGLGLDFDGNDVLWINRGSEIYPYTDTLGDEITANSTDEDVVIEKSGAIEFVAEEGSSIILLMFEGEGSIGATMMDPNKEISDYEWYSKADMIEAMPDMKDMVEGIDRIVYDYVSFGSYSYIATPMFAPFMVTNSVVEDFENLDTGDSDMPSIAQLESIVTFFTVKDEEGETLIIKTLAAIEGEKLYLGSDSALYVADIEADGSLEVDGNITDVVTGTDGKNITKLVANTSYIAALYDGGVLIIEDNAVIKDLRFFSGVPTDVSDIMWMGSTLYISGTSGIVTIDAGEL